MPSNLIGDAEMITLIKRNICTEWSVTFSCEKFDVVNLLIFRKPFLFEKKLIEAVYMWLNRKRLWSIEEDYLCGFWTFCRNYYIVMLYHCCHLQLQYSSFEWSDQLTNGLECRRDCPRCPFYGALWFSLAEQGLRLTVDTPLSEHGGIRKDNMISLLRQNYSTYDNRYLR